MALESDLYQLLSKNASVLAALNNSNNVWMGMIPKGQPVSPAIVVQAVYTDNQYTADGINTTKMRRVQFDSYAKKYTDALTISNTVRDVLKNLTGQLGTTDVLSALVRRDMDMPDEPGDSGYVFRRLLEVEFWYAE